MDWSWFEADGYHLARWLLQRGIAVVYLLAFVNVVHQWVPLLGDRGLTPAREILGPRAARQAPSLFHHVYGDRLAVALGWVGIAGAVALLVGLPQEGPPGTAMAVFALLWALYLSYVNVGRIFYAFGWESLLVEAGFLAIFLGVDQLAPAWPILLAFRWLLLRVELGAGLIKWRGDACWRELTCTEYHHETQPLPNPLSWRFHQLPRWQHRVEVASNHVTQLVVPVGLLLPQPVAGACATIMIVTQAYLMLSGNFAWLNLVTIVLGFAALPDAWLGWLPLDAPQDHAATPTWFVAVVLAVAAVLVWRSWYPVQNLLSSRQRMNASHDPLRLVNSYGAFGSVTRVRHELVIEATGEPEPGEDDWAAYEFPAKPTALDRRPPQVAPYHLRLDWLLWFAALAPAPERHVWFRRLLERLLEADPRILRLVRWAPCGHDPPAAVRVRRFRYRFATPTERGQTGRPWVREDPEVAVPAVHRPSR